MKKPGGKRPSPGERLELKVGEPAPQGDMVSRRDGYVLFLEGGLPGEKVLAKVVKVQTNHGRARVIKALEPSSERVAPPCPVFLRCGGCRYQHAQDETQRRWKSQILESSLKRPVPLKRGSPSYRYRVKAQPGLLVRRGKAVLALLERESHTPVETPDCLLYREEVRKVLDLALAELPLEQALAARNLVVRAAPTTGQALVGLVSLRRQGAALKAWAEKLMGREGIRGVVENVNPRPGAVIWGPETSVLAGRDEIREKIGSISFRVGTGDFFQASTEGAEALLAHVRERLGPRTGGGTLWDLYAGVGLFGLSLASSFRRTVLVEENAPALGRAKMTARDSGLPRTEFRAGSVDQVLESLDAGDGDVLIADPPRSGLSPRLRSLIRSAGFRDFLYVSCDPATLARDLESLAGTYELLDVTGFDLFPQTAHVEAVAHLRSRER